MIPGTLAVKKGTLTREVANIKLDSGDFDISRVITNALLNAGYDVVAVPKYNDNMTLIGESFTVYRSIENA